MIHSSDYDAMEKMFRGSVPDDVRDEYAIVRKMADCYGHTGALGPYLIIPMLRRLGYGRVVERQVENVDWRRHMNEPVQVKYGDKVVDGKVVGLGVNSRLVVETREYGELELPRHCVSLVPEIELSVAPNPWAAVEMGAPVVVHSGDKDVRGKFAGLSDEGVLVKVGSKETVYACDEVELKG